ncbi:MAG: hypothetical protein ABSE18_01730 [Minisyncoccia bacterium]|jgi:hypothetical protein
MKKKTKRIATEAGAGILTAAALAAAGAYLLSSKRQRAKMKAWAVKARHEVAKNVRTARRMGEREYKRVVDRATKHYGSLHDVNAREVVRVAQDMKAEWSRLQKNAKVLMKIARGKRSSRKARRRKK